MISIERRREINRKSYYKNRDKVLKYQREYHKDNKKKRKIQRHNYYKKNKKRILRKAKEYREKQEYKEKNREYKREYRKDKNFKEREKASQRTPEHREKVNFKRRKRKLDDKNFAVQQRLRRLLQNAMKNYTQTGKIWNASKYGIDYKLIIEHLKPFPEDISKYHIDHIIPLCKFDLTNLEEIKKAFAPENHKWLLKEENLKKGGRYINIENKEIQ